MSRSDEILAVLRELVRTHLDHAGSLSLDARLADELDSLQLMSLAVAVEDRFEIRLDEADERAIETVGDLVSLVADRLAASGPSTSDRSATLDV